MAYRFSFFLILSLFNICLCFAHEEDESGNHDDLMQITTDENQIVFKIPENIETDLVLNYSKKVFITNGFTLQRGAKLTIEPGVKILTEKTKEKAKPIIIEGQLICGTKTGANIEWRTPSTIELSGAKVEFYNTRLLSSTFSIVGGTEGVFENCKIERYFTRRTIQPIEITLPKRNVVKFSKCHFINHSIELPENINEVRDKIQFDYCAFSPVWDEKIKKYLPVAIDCKIFLVGNKCDLNTYIKWQTMKYTFEPAFQTNWYIKDPTMKTQLESAISKINGLKVNFSSPYTNFRPALPPVEKKSDKK